MPAERRREPRVRRNDPVTIEWCDASYVTHRVSGHCIDASSTGMRLRLSGAVPSGQYVQIETGDTAFRGSGTVRFARPEGEGFVAGIRFAWQMRTRAA